MKRVKTAYERFAQNTSNKRLLEQENLIIDATEVLSAIMENEKLTKADLARRLGKSKSYVTQVLSGRANLTLRTLGDLGVSMGYRFGLQATNIESGHVINWQTRVPSLGFARSQPYVCWSATSGTLKGVAPLERQRLRQDTALALSA